MEEQVHDQAAIAAAGGAPGQEPESRLTIPLIVFAVSSIAFLVYIAFGTIEARIWRFGRLRFEDRTIRHVWSYFGDRLPELPAQGLITVLYWIALAVLVIATVLGLWLFLGTADEDPARELSRHGQHHSASRA